MKIQARLILALLVTIASSQAFADYIFGPALSYETLKEEVDGSTTDDTKMLTLDLRLGYVFNQNGLYVGAMYKLEKDDFQGGDLNGYALGPSIGYVNSNGFSALVTYHIMAERKYTSSGTEAKYSSGQGYQLDIAYAPEITSGFGIGPQMTYRYVKFEKQKIGPAPETSTSREITSLDPTLVFWFTF